MGSFRNLRSGETSEEPEPKPTGVITLINNKTGAIEVMASGLAF